MLVLLTACTNQQPRYVIGVSQCSDDIWREKQNSELQMDAYFHDNVELRFAAAFDNDERQIQQIDSLVATGIDLLIVAPNQVATITPAIDRAYDKGIPVIIFERKTNSQKYTAFISADNYEMGRVMGEYIATSLKGKGNVLEIMGLKGSSPAIERHNGFVDALKAYPDIRLVETLQGDWTEQSAFEAVRQYEGDLSSVDYVFGQNDRMAMGARKALLASQSSPLTTKFCGIDGLPGKDGGISLVKDSLLEASYIYPTHGDQLLDVALEILEGKPYKKERKLMSALVTQENANVLLMQSDEIIRQSKYVEQLYTMSDNYLRELNTQHVVNGMAVGIIVLLLLTLVLLYRYHLRKVALQHERVVNTLWNMKPEDAEKDAPQPDEAPLPENNSSDEEPDPVSTADSSHFITRFREVVEARMADSEVSGRSGCRHESESSTTLSQGKDPHRLFTCRAAAHGPS